MRKSHKKAHSTPTNLKDCWSLREKDSKGPANDMHNVCTSFSDFGFVPLFKTRSYVKLFQAQCTLLKSTNENDALFAIYKSTVESLISHIPPCAPLKHTCMYTVESKRSECKARPFIQQPWGILGG